MELPSSHRCGERRLCCHPVRLPGRELPRELQAGRTGVHGFPGGGQKGRPCLDHHPPKSSPTSRFTKLTTCSPGVKIHWREQAKEAVEACARCRRATWERPLCTREPERGSPQQEARSRKHPGQPRSPYWGIAPCSASIASATRAARTWYFPHRIRRARLSTWRCRRAATFCMDWRISPDSRSGQSRLTIAQNEIISAAEQNPSPSALDAPAVCPAVPRDRVSCLRPAIWVSGHPPAISP